ncbi:response regulator transcription factor [Nakamurella sp. PAMC28650]|jgi:two-component system response regulator RegX3|uniref:response regulator transcription factor n=1 Tax=Nakamurella sp. PAMC28650 TaxID=2762325 RepID=UPI00164EBF22|nr:response regulator transcription factor [Nakamurella sp. PAMC28650]QNK80329.1 response regulator transcription factor [Nakamurella sp. PAMC28650]
MKVLVVEDDPAVFVPLLEGLRRNGLEVDHARTGTEVVAAARHVDLVLLDLGLPDADGLDVLKALRQSSDVPVIVVTARGDETDRVVGLELGADDYVVKPFSVRELSARIRAIARRRRIEAPLETGRLRIDRTRRSTWIDGSSVQLTAKEFELLAVLAEQPGRVVPRSELLARVWDPIWHGSGKSLDVHVSVIRRKLGAPELIETVRGVGYRLVENCE